MIGKAKHLNTKYDYEWVKEHQENWKEYWQDLYDSRMIWAATELVGDGINDDTHRVIQSQDVTTNTITSIQQEFMLDDYCKLLRIGFTVDEVEEVLLYGE